MKIKIVSVGKIKDKNIAALISEYAKRIPRLEFINVKDSGMATEGARLLSHFCSYNIVLSEEGRSFTSLGFSRLLKDKGEAAFFIGGPEGVASEVKDKADLVLSLSNMTLTHEIAQLILVEQLYRSHSIQCGSPYHK